MNSKLLFIMLGIVIIAGVIFYTSKLGDSSFSLEPEAEKTSEYKKELDYSAFENGLETLDEKRTQELNKMVLDQPIATIQNHITNKDLSYEELVLFYVNRIKEYNDDVHAVIELNQKALEQAQEIDKKIEEGTPAGELFGVVVLIKDNISSVDMNTSSGAYALKDVTTNRDSFFVTKLKEQDAIILGKANLSEWSNFMSVPSSNGFSTLGGQTMNAYGKFDVGGSSSGSSVAASLNLSTVAVGSETSGSLIHPAGQNSVVTLKPTTGLISRDLIVPITEAQDTAGIIAKNVEDLKKVFNVAIAFDENDKKANVVNELNEQERTQALEKDYLKGKRLGYVDYGNEQLNGILKELEEMGVELVKVKIDDSNLDTFSVMLYGIKNDLNKFLNDPDVNSEFKTLEEIVEYNKQGDSENKMPYGQYLLEEGANFELSKQDYNNLVIQNQTTAANVIDTVLEENNIEAIVSISNELSGIYAPANYPAITVPSGYKDSGEPFGITIVGSKNDDFKLLQMGYSYEQTTNHRKSPVK